MRRFRVVQNRVLSLVLALTIVVPCIGATRAAKIESYAGNISVMRNAKPVRPRIGLFLLSGDKISTQSESAVTLVLKDKSKLRISEKTFMTIESCEYGANDARKMSVFVKVGDLMCNMKKIAGRQSDFEVKTPTAVAAIRGTIFQTRVNSDGSSSFGVLQGVISVGKARTGGYIAVGANQKARVSEKSNVVAAEPLPKAERKELVEAAKSITTSDEQAALAAAPAAKEEKSEEDGKGEDSEEEEEAESEDEKEDEDKSEEDDEDDSEGETDGESDDEADGETKEGEDGEESVEESDAQEDEGAQSGDTEAGEEQGAGESGGMEDEASESGEDLPVEEGAGETLEPAVVDDGAGQEMQESPDMGLMDAVMEEVLPQTDIPVRSEVPPEEIIESNASPSAP